MLTRDGNKKVEIKNMRENKSALEKKWRIKLTLLRTEKYIIDS